MSEELKQRVYQTVANHPRSSLYGIADLLGEKLKDVRIAVRELKAEGRIDRYKRPTPLFTQLTLWPEK